MNSNGIKSKVIIVCGPTGSGKTAIAILLAKAFGGNVISADSMQVYRLMDIGTAKPTPIEQARIKHHLIDIVDPDESFNAAGFAEIAARLIDNMSKKKIVPFVAGGTGLYIKALLHGLFKAGPVDPDLRTRLKEKAAAGGASVLYEQLSRCDDAAAQKIHPNDTYRIIRALEIFEATGKAISDYRREHLFRNTPYDVLKIGLDIDRKVLYEKINRRVDKMIKEGLLAEVKNLMNKGYDPNLKSMQSIGYRHMADFIQERLSWEEALRILKRDTRRYAKRQLTWFKRDPEVNWVDPGRLHDIHRMVDRFLF